MKIVLVLLCTLQSLYSVAQMEVLRHSIEPGRASVYSYDDIIVVSNYIRSSTTSGYDIFIKDGEFKKPEAGTYQYLEKSAQIEMQENGKITQVLKTDHSFTVRQVDLESDKSFEQTVEVKGLSWVYAIEIIGDEVYLLTYERISKKVHGYHVRTVNVGTEQTTDYKVEFTDIKQKWLRFMKFEKPEDESKPLFIYFYDGSDRSVSNVHISTVDPVNGFVPQHRISSKKVSGEIAGIQYLETTEDGEHVFMGVASNYHKPKNPLELFKYTSKPNTPNGTLEHFSLDGKFIPRSGQFNRGINVSLSSAGLGLGNSSYNPIKSDYFYTGLKQISSKDGEHHFWVCETYKAFVSESGFVQRWVFCGAFTFKLDDDLEPTWFTPIPPQFRYDIKITDQYAVWKNPHPFLVHGSYTVDEKGNLITVSAQSPYHILSKHEAKDRIKIAERKSVDEQSYLTLRGSKISAEGEVEDEWKDIPLIPDDENLDVNLFHFDDVQLFWLPDGDLCCQVELTTDPKFYTTGNYDNFKMLTIWIGY